MRWGVEWGGAVGCVGALERMRPTEKRGNLVEWGGAEIVNDTYNSNPKALEGMVEALRKTEAKRRIVVAGEMLELGPEGASLHEACGEAMAGVDVVVGVRGLARELVAGARAAGVEAEFVETPELAGEWLRENLREGDVVLLKASRGVKLERALEVLRGRRECERMYRGRFPEEVQQGITQEAQGWAVRLAENCGCTIRFDDTDEARSVALLVALSKIVSVLSGVPDLSLCNVSLRVCEHDGDADRAADRAVRD